MVREVSWVNNCWPEEFPGDQIQFERPLVQSYCLMGVKDSYTDFHVDFGGTSVWYHVLRVSFQLSRAYGCPRISFHLIFFAYVHSTVKYFFAFVGRKSLLFNMAHRRKLGAI